MEALDFAFAWEGASGPAGPWQHLRVVDFVGREGISTLYRYEITVFAREPAPEVDPDDLMGARATLRVATGTEPRSRVVHGILTEAEELGPVQGGVLYRVVLSPPLARAAHRARCRIFLQKTTRQIIDAVLQGDPALRRMDGAVVEPDDGLMGAFTPAGELFAWRVSDTSRIDQVAARPYCVQYNESDLAFVSRLLEEEGISAHYEHGDGVCLLVLADSDAGRARLEPFEPLGPDQQGRVVTAMKLGARLRARKVSLQDYDWRKPALGMAVQEIGQGGGGDLVDHEYPGRYADSPDHGRLLAAAKLGRLEVEASYAAGEGPCRLLSAGSIFALEHPRPRHGGEYLVTRLEVRGDQRGVLFPSAAAPEGPHYTCSFECARRGKDGAAAESRFRPARVTPRPRILGSQTAFVTAEPSAQGAEIHVGGPPGGEIGCVRLRFHWDEDTARHAKEPTSCWVRVSQVFAGAGEGAVWHPRVGVEVIVDFEDGDPDRPIVVGRVYNGQNRPPVDTPTVSTLKTMTSPGDGTYNELTFDDTAGSQQIKLLTPRDWNSVVGHDRTEQVAERSLSSVGTDRAESTGVNRMTLVGTDNTEVIGSNEAIMVGADQVVTVGADQRVMIGADQQVVIGKSQDVRVGADQTVAVTRNQGLAVGGDRSLAVQGNLTQAIEKQRGTAVTGDDVLQVQGRQSVTIQGAQQTALLSTHTLTVAETQTIVVQGAQITAVEGAQQQSSNDRQLFYAPSQQLTAEGSQVLQSTTFDVEASGAAAINTKQLFLVGGAEVTVAGGKLVIAMKGDVSIQGENISIEGKKITLNGKRLAIDGGDEVEVRGALIKLN